ncbi:AAEL008312-PA [Aedes aegypti]|uniref:AAEL008312-PA n=1 Tax=Aedes aegypti TaxID=7159 RepID=Q16Z62_AEDAE|nr:AAEL008312-PA [Aedes aegypti]
MRMMLIACILQRFQPSTTMALKAVLTSFLAVTAIVVSSAQNRESCIASTCKTYKDINTLWCHADPTYFCQCRTDASGAWVEQVMPCSRNGTLFSFRKQTCVHQDLWDQNECLLMGQEKEEVSEQIDECSNPCGTYQEISQLWCHPASDRKLFCQCRPTDVQRVFRTVPMPCATGTSFSFKKQTCVHDAMWVDSCP